VGPAIKARDFKGPGSFVGDSDGAALIAHTLRAEGHDASEDGTGRGVPIVPVAYSVQEDNQNGVIMRDIAGTVRSTAPGSQQGGSLALVEPMTFDWQAGGGGADTSAQGVRRLMPHELERLQGFPDGYTLIPDQLRRPIEDDYAAWYMAHYPDATREEVERFSKDGPRAKALGNSMAVPVMRWIGERIALVEATSPPPKP